jgi:hypothetical protein
LTSGLAATPSRGTEEFPERQTCRQESFDGNGGVPRTAASVQRCCQHDALRRGSGELLLRTRRLVDDDGLPFAAFARSLATHRTYLASSTCQVRKVGCAFAACPESTSTCREIATFHLRWARPATASEVAPLQVQLPGRSSPAEVPWPKFPGRSSLAEAPSADAPWPICSGPMPRQAPDEGLAGLTREIGCLRNHLRNATLSVPWTNTIWTRSHLVTDGAIFKRPAHPFELSVRLIGSGRVAPLVFARLMAGRARCQRVPIKAARRAYTFRYCRMSGKMVGSATERGNIDQVG